VWHLVTLMGGLTNRSPREAAALAAQVSYGTCILRCSIKCHQAKCKYKSLYMRTFLRFLLATKRGGTRGTHSRSRNPCTPRVALSEA
jgi:hypothetical protein